MALTDKLAGDYRSQRRYSADKKRYPSGLVSDKTPTPFYGSGGKQFLRCRGLRRWVQKNNLLVELWPERKLSSRRRLSLFIISGFSTVYGGAFCSHRCFCYAFYRIGKSVISIPFFGQFIIISVHRKVAFYGLFVLFRIICLPPYNVGMDRKIKNLEESYEQDKNNQTVVIVKPNRK